MKRKMSVAFAALVLAASAFVVPRASAATVRAKVEAKRNVDDLVQGLRKQLSERGHSLEIVFDGSHDLRFVGVAEEGFGGQQGTIVVLSKECDVLTAITRSGRMTIGGAFNAAAKEIVKELQAIGALR